MSTRTEADKREEELFPFPVDAAVFSAPLAEDFTSDSFKEERRASAALARRRASWWRLSSSSGRVARALEKIRNKGLKDETLL